MLILGFVIVQTIIFGVVFFVLRRMMIQNTTSAVNRLKVVDEENQKRLEDMKKKIEEAEAEYKQKTAEQAQELEKQRLESQKLIEEEKNKVLNKVREESDKILGAAKSRSEKIDQKIAEEVHAHAAIISMEAVRRILSNGMTSAFNDQLVSQFLKDVETLDAGHVPEDVREAEVVMLFPLSENGKNRIQQILAKKIGILTKFTC